MKKIISLTMMITMIISCQTDQINLDDSNIDTISKSGKDPYFMDGKLAENPKDRMRNAVLELTELSKIILLNPKVQSELGSMVSNNFYKDHVISLNELLDPQNSLVYGYSNQINKNNIGSFAAAYETEVNENAKSYVNLTYVLANRSTESSDFYEQAYLTYYLPYDTNDNDVDHNLNSIPTLIPAVIDADSGLAYKLDSGNSWGSTVADDNYSAATYSLIIAPNFDECSTLSFQPTTFVASAYNYNVDCGEVYSGGGSSSGGGVSGGSSGGVTTSYTGNCNTLEKGSTHIREVYIGLTKLRKQYDSYISFTNNGGGSEMRFCRAGSRDNVDTDSLGNITLNQWNVRKNSYITRKQIRKENVLQMGLLWDANWQCLGSDENLLVFYEEDTEGDLVIDQDISFADGDDYSLDVDITIQNRSKDQVIIKHTLNSNSFFVRQNLPGACGGDWTGRGAFDDRTFPIYDCGSDIPYTMYHRWVAVNDNSDY